MRFIRLKIIATALIAILFNANSFSQSRQVIGKVVDAETGKGIGNANIVILGTTLGAISNFGGYFQLNLEEGHNELMISHVAYEKAKLEVPEADKFQVSLERSLYELPAFDLANYPLEERPEKLKTIQQNENNTDSEFKIIEIDAHYPGGWKAFHFDLGNSLDSFFAVTKKPSVTSFAVTFTTDTNGDETNIKVYPDSLSYLTQPIEKVFEKNQRWDPAKQHDHGVNQHFVQLIKTGIEEIYIRVDDPPVPPDGLFGFYQYVAQNLRYPPKARDLSIVGKVFVQFIVDTDGSITDIKVVKGIGGGCDEEAIRVISGSPKWIPGFQKGKPVKVRMILPITFKIDGVRMPKDNFNPEGSLRSAEIALKDNPNFGPLYRALGRNLRYPYQARKNGIEGRLYVKFELDSLEPEIISTEIVNDIGGGCGKEVLDQLKALPGSLFYHFPVDVNTKYYLPVTFKIGNNVKTELADLAFEDHIELTEIVVTVVSSGKAGVGYKVTPVKTVFISLEEALKTPNKVKRLELVNAGIKSLPETVGTLKNLILLDVEKNELKSLPNEIANLSYLHEIYAPFNKIDDLPTNLSGLKKLKVLSLSNNNFSEFPDVIANIKNLETLDLGSNKIAKIPDQIGNLTKLTTLVLSNNQISNLPESIYELKRLERLYLNGNPLPDETIDQLKLKLKRTKIITE